MLGAVLAGDAARVAGLLDAHPELCNLSDRSEDRLGVLQHAARLGRAPVVGLLLRTWKRGLSVDGPWRGGMLRGWSRRRCGG